MILQDVLDKRLHQMKRSIEWADAWIRYWQEERTRAINKAAEYIRLIDTALPEEYWREFTEMETMAIQNQSPIPSIEKFLFAKKMGVKYASVFLIDGVKFAIEE